DITILGYFRDNATVGVYTLASKIYSTIKNVINAVILVALPRLSFYLGHQMDHEYNALLKKIYDYLITLLLPVIAGLFILSKPIMLIVGGMQYSDGYVPLALLSLSLLFAALACYFATSIILLYKQDNVYLMATLISCFSNVALNFILIPYMGYVGASLTTLIAEMLMCLITWYYSLKLPNIQEHKVYLFADRSVLISSIIGSLGILVIGLLIKDVVGNPFINVGITFVLSVLFYFIILLIFKNPILTLFMKKLKIKLKR
ncbi:MAG: oligosaccharide flippase family protein, partial [Intestinibaculum porci]|uniref:oligosaccharide flippase family protein n=1 Tax=Intestinibaculum porci TaxID=2487118 RepID=UPI00240A5B39